MPLQWITTISSIYRWPHVWIGYFTHGNEPVGAKIMQYLIHEYQIHTKIISGSISFIPINTAASEKKVRFIDHNMNRIRDTAFQSNSQEHIRKKELTPFLETIDMFFDMHSTSKPSPCTIITDEQLLDTAKSFASCEEIRVGDMKQQWALISFFIKQGKPWFGIEAGSHNDEQWYQQWIINVLNFLSLYCIIQEPLQQKRYNKIYRFLDEVFCTQLPFQYTQDFVWISSVLPWAIIANDGKNIIRNHYTKANISFWLATNDPLPWDGAGFFFEQIE